MRNAFIKSLTELAEKDNRIFLIVGDLGFGVIEDFQKRFPKQFINAGVAEQNMTGMAAGLAMSGKIVFTYSIGNFPTLRCLEQIRNDVCYHRANVKIVTVGGGFAYGALGSSHHATEDLAILRSLPNMTVVAPGDPMETVEATKQVAVRPGPCYLRLSRSNDQIVYTTVPEFRIGKAILFKDGYNLTIISTGGMLPVAVNVAKILSEHGLEARILSMHTIKPLDFDAIQKAAEETKLLITIEEHSLIGGLGSAVAEAVIDLNLHSCIVKRIGIKDTFAIGIGSQEFLRKQHGLSIETILDLIKSSIKSSVYVG